MTDPLDQPDEDRYDLLYPFIVCTSQGGPFDDDAFVAGVQLGRVDQALQVGHAIGTSRIGFTVRTDLVKQLELVGMARGYPLITTEFGADDVDPDGEWSYVIFERGE